MVPLLYNISGLKILSKSLSPWLLVRGSCLGNTSSRSSSSFFRFKLFLSMDFAFFKLLSSVWYELSSIPLNFSHSNRQQMNSHFCRIWISHQGWSSPFLFLRFRRLKKWIRGDLRCSVSSAQSSSDNAEFRRPHHIYLFELQAA
jgi:hypothetical protein